PTRRSCREQPSRPEHPVVEIRERLAQVSPAARLLAGVGRGPRGGREPGETEIIRHRLDPRVVPGVGDQERAREPAVAERSRCAPHDDAGRSDRDEGKREPQYEEGEDRVPANQAHRRRLAGADPPTADPTLHQSTQVEATAPIHPSWAPAESTNARTARSLAS